MPYFFKMRPFSLFKTPFLAKSKLIYEYLFSVNGEKSNFIYPFGFITKIV